jgi:hypothetical protein
MTSRRRLILVVSVVLLAAAGAMAYALVRHAERPRLADCYTGFGAMASGEHLLATVRLVEHGGVVTGTYVAGASAGQGLAFDVRGRLDGSRFDGTFTTLGQPLRVTGSMQPDQVVLDNPSGEFTVTRLIAGCG